MTVRAWDLAGTEGTEGCPDWTAGVKLSRQENGSFLVEDVLRFRASAGDVPGAVRRCAEADGRQVAIGLPQDPGQAGKAQVSFLAGLLAGFKVVASPETGSKRVRAMGVASQFCNGKIHLRRGAWNTEFLDELASFPHGREDDQVDALSRAFNMMTAPENPARFAYLPHTTR
jgi:predicted phage terminase large subunit-like protein